MICTKKTYGLNGLNHQIIEKSLDVMPLTDGRTENGKWKTGDPGGPGVTGIPGGPSGPISRGGPGGPCDLRSENGRGD